jgi:hypothetical protein
VTDRALDPPAENVFDQFNPEKVGTLPDPTLADNPFTKFNPFENEDPRPAPPKTSGTGSFFHGLERGIAPAIGSLPAIGAGAELGATVGSFGGPIGTAVGGLAGGIAGAVGAGSVISAAQDWAVSKLPDSWQEALGQDQRTRRLEESQHSTAAFMGGLVPFALTMRPGAVPKVALPENATALQRIMANPATARLFGGGVMGGLELGTELIHGEAPDWTKVGISTGFGVVFNKPTRIGERLIESGARPARAVMGRPSPEAPEAPTIAQAADAKVMGPGVTEDVFHGSHEQSVPSSLTAQEQARTEQSLIGNLPEADLHEVARRIDPDAFAEYDTLQRRRDTLQAFVDEQRPIDSHSVHQQLAKTQAEIDELAPRVAAAYRRAEEGVNGAPEEAAPPAMSGAETTARPMAAQREAIAGDVTRQLVAAGRPQEEASAAAQLIAARYEARARWFNGTLGTAEELYAREGAEIRGPGRTEPLTSAGPSEPPPLPTNRQELADYLAKGGRVEAGPKEFAQQEPASPFYSAAARAVDNVKMEKASPDQWLATIRNTPGVKGEELEWLGIGDWLKEQKGPVTKQEVQDYVRANQIEVKEVEKGKAVPTEVRDAAISAEREFNEYATDLADKYDLNPNHNLSMYRKLKGMEQAEVDKYDVLQSKWLRAKEAQMEAAGGPTKFSSYTLPGGENYREMLLTLPPKLEGATGLTMNDIASRLGYGGWTSSLTPAQKAHVEQVFDAQKMGPVEFNKEIATREDRIEDLRRQMRGTSGSDAIRSEISQLSRERDLLP